MALVHRAGHVGQGSAVLVGVLFAIPTLQQPEAHPPWIEIQRVDLIVGDVAERLGIPAALLGRTDSLLLQLGALRCHRRQGDQAAEHHKRHGQQEPALAQTDPALGSGLGSRRSRLSHATLRSRLLGVGSNQGTMEPSATSHCW